MTPHKVVLMQGPEPSDSEVPMRFRLYYEGILRPTGRDPIGFQSDPLAAHKQEIRKCFHIQLQQLWRTNRFLREHKVDAKVWTTRPVGDEKSYWGGGETRVPMVDVIATRYREFGYRFVPLVIESYSLLCSLNILFLRRDAPGSVLTAGDIDNRLKTLIDALRRPRNASELAGHEIPAAGEDRSG